MTAGSQIDRVTGRAVAVAGQDIDTDRIMPARFLKAITFDGLEAHVFADDRQQSASRGEVHPFDDPVRGGARVLLVNANFGCGSSREHAPQAIRRWGIEAIVGESFAEIFFGNAVAIGLPCVTASPVDVERLMQAADRQPEADVMVDIQALLVTAGGLSVPISLPDTARHALLSGDWDAARLLVERPEDVARTASRLPYLTGFPPRSPRW